MCFDLGELETFKNLPNWYSRLMENAGTVTQLFLVGCKSDLPQSVPEDAIEKYAVQVKAEYFKTSAVSNLNTMNLLKRAILVYYLGTFKLEVPPDQLPKKPEATQNPPPGVELDGGSQNKKKKKQKKKNIC
jgi:GTPase SAR1 family protein